MWWRAFKSRRRKMSPPSWWPSLDSINSSFTISFWIKPFSQIGEYGTIVAYRNRKVRGPSVTGLKKPKGIQYKVALGNRHKYLISNEILPRDKWSFCVVQYDSASGTITANKESNLLAPKEILFQDMMLMRHARYGCWKDLNILTKLWEEQD